MFIFFKSQIGRLFPKLFLSSILSISFSIILSFKQSNLGKIVDFHSGPTN